MSKSLEEYSREELIEQINSLKRQKKYGLVWEEKPEKVVEECRTKLPVVEEIAERAIKSAPGEVTNLIIEGDNYHALSILNYTHAGKIDVIYIDPPYNTGNKDFIYNDCYVDKEDAYRHSKWLNFMEKRLKLVRELLSEHGIIFISIDDNEQSQLKILCDDIFGEDNFISNIIWYKNNSKGNVKSISCVTEYVLCYAKNHAHLPRFETTKENAAKMCEVAKEMFKSNNCDIDKTNKEFKAWLKENNISAGEKKYNRVDDHGRLYTDKPLTAPGSKLFYDIYHPVTKKPCKHASRGWAYKKESFEELLKSGHILFGKDENTCPYLKYFLDENIHSVPTSHIQLTANNSVDLQILGFKKEDFNYPKPVKLIKELLCFINSKDMTVLDFFAGSGTTGQAVMELNKEDGGNRQFILVTNNDDKDNRIAENITYPRIKALITGIRLDGSKYSDGIPANLRYFKTAFVDKRVTTDDTREAIVTKCSDMIRIRENAFEFVASTPQYRFYKSDKKFVPIIFDQFAIEETWEKVEELNTDRLPVHVYNFSYNRHANEEEIPETDLEWTACSIPESVLEVYRRIFRKKEDKNAA